MSRDGAVVVDRVWKRFKADARRPMLRDEVERLLSRSRVDEADRWRWVLRQIDFRLEPGESVGLFGTNGSGKSTLLKLLTRIMYPTAGSIAVHGRVGALIELRAGIHPELTGRENVFMYGSILGLDRPTIARRFDEIIGFAELEDAIDRQVKYYSSGMAMRIGFAVAAFLEPHVLLVDEVMAVGDAAFQQKCLDRMRAVIASGTTVGGSGCRTGSSARTGPCATPSPTTARRSRRSPPTRATTTTPSASATSTSPAATGHRPPTRACASAPTSDASRRRARP